MRERSGFAKIVAVSAFVFCVSLGLCGLTVSAGDSSANGGGTLRIAALWAEAAALVLSFLTLVVTLLRWLEIAMWEKHRGANAGFQKLFDDKKRNRE